MSFLFLDSLSSLVSQVRSGNRERAIDRVRTKWSFDDYYAALIEKISAAAAKEPCYWLKLPEADLAFNDALVTRLRGDGFVVRRPGETEDAEPGMPRAMMISGWASTDQKGGEAGPIMNLTDWHFRAGEWRDLIREHSGQRSWVLGEFVDKGGRESAYQIRRAANDFSLAFLGQSGAGKTEAMKNVLSAFMAMNRETRVQICDLKQTGDWDVFAPFSDRGQIVKSVAETFEVISDTWALAKERLSYMAASGHKNYQDWEKAEGKTISPLILVIDEFSQLNDRLRYGIECRREGTPANALFCLISRCRTAGIFVMIGSQFAGVDAIPSEINKNIKVHICLRTGSEGESMQWINSPAAFRLGKGARRPDGEEDHQEGYAYADSEAAHVRFHQTDDVFILLLLLSSGISITDLALVERTCDMVQKDLGKRLTSGGGALMNRHRGLSTEQLLFERKALTEGMGEVRRIVNQLLADDARGNGKSAEKPPLAKGE